MKTRLLLACYASPVKRRHLLAFSTTVTNSGLQTFFKLRPDDFWTEKFFFWGSIVWSFKTCFSTYMKVKEEKKSHMLSLIRKIFLGISCLLFQPKLSVNLKYRYIIKSTKHKAVMARLKKLPCRINVNILRL